MDNMVLQGAPQNANIWGFLGRNLDPIELIMNCSNHVETQTYLPVQVRDTYCYYKYKIHNYVFNYIFDI